MNVLFLDDDPIRTKRFRSAVPSATTVSTAFECIKQLNNKNWDIVFLDHDLGGESFCDSSRADTGMEVVRWMVENKPTIDTIVVHSLNAAANNYMCMDLSLAGYRARSVPFSLLFDDLQSILDSVAHTNDE